jgi:hypothetical protein
MEKGRQRLRTRKLGFKVNQFYYCPAEFGEAYLGIMGESELEKLVRESREKILEREITPRNAPYLAEHVTNRERKNKPFDLEYIKSITKALTGTYKLISEKAIDEEDIGTLSIRGLINIPIKPRRDVRTESERKYNVKLIRPFIESVEYLTMSGFRGNTPYEEFNLLKGNLFSAMNKRDREFVDALSKKVGKHYEDKKIFLAKDAIEQDLFEESEIAGYDVACALSMLYKLKKEGNLDIKEKLDLDEWEVVMPFDYFSSPEQALNVLLMKHDLRRGKKGVGKIERMYSIDKSNLDKVASKQFNEALSKGITTRNVVVSRHDFSSGAWTGVYALVDHHYMNGRRFTGFTLEFKDTMHETPSIVFEGIPSYPLSNKNLKLSTRIVFDRLKGLPYSLYKNFSVPEGFDATGLKVSPRRMINFGKDVKDNRYKDHKWGEYDYMTGNPAECSLWEPTMKIRKAQSAYASMKGISLNPSMIRKKYIDNYMGRSLKKEFKDK